MVARGGDLQTGELRGFLRERLPEPMVPAAFVLLDALPLTANGKLDRKALPAPDARGRPRFGMPGAPQRNRGRDRLRLARGPGPGAVGVEDNFFDLGGHSLLIVQVHRRLAPRFPGLAVVDLFRYPTVGALAQFLTREKVEQISLAESRERADARSGRSRRQRDLRRQARTPGSGR